MMKCEYVLERLTAYIDGELSLEEQQTMTSHFAACKSCHNALKELLAIMKAMPALSEMDPPPGFRAQVMDSVRKEVEQQPQTTWWKRFNRAWYPLRAAAALLVLCLTLSYNIYPFATAYIANHGQDSALEDSVEPLAEVEGVKQAPNYSKALQTDDSGMKAGIMAIESTPTAAEETAEESSNEMAKRIVITTFGAGIAAALAYSSKRKEAH